MYSKTLVLAVVLGVTTGSAHAVLVGGAYDVDPSLGILSFNSASGSFSTNSHPNADLGALSNNWGGVFDGNNSAARRLNFLGSDPGSGDPNVVITGVFQNPIFNNPGIDIIAFEQGDVPTDADGNSVPANDPTNDELELLAASVDGSSGTFGDFTVLDFLTSAQVGGTATNFGVYVFGLDLDTIGVAPGDSITSLVFGNTGAFLDHDPDIVWGGGVVGADSVAIPESSAGLLVLAVGLVGARRSRRQRRPRLQRSIDC